MHVARVNTLVGDVGGRDLILGEEPLLIPQTVAVPDLDGCAVIGRSSCKIQADPVVVRQADRDAVHQVPLLILQTVAVPDLHRGA